MYAISIVIAILIFCIIIIRMFMKDSKHDLEINFGKFKFSMKKHDKE